ncbi:MAG: hypothetical protein JWO25_1959 [Alphaproteobacteria bacterium]|nr:hypothetical protein [Alphaproteobacteria bacterium]MDB5721606.1 hypothetical protein [Alphaproteobacteria bacterium]
MPAPDDSAEDLLAKAGTCRRIAQGMGGDPLALSLMEIAEEYEARAAALGPTVMVNPDRPV